MSVSPRVSTRSAVEPFLAMDVITEARQLAAAGRHIVHMEVGEPGWPAPEAALEAARRCIATGRIGYTQALGLPSLRERIARHYLETYGLEVPAGRVAVTTGSSAAFVLAFTAMFDAGDRVAITAPGYPPYRNTLKALGVEPVEIETGPASRWAPTAAAIRAAHRDKPLAGLLIMSPGNPTGTMIGREALAEIAEACAELKIALISDEIYHGLTYGEPATSALSVAPDAVVIHSFSKYFRMTGWRIGWMVLPELLVRTVERLTQNLYISAPEIAQVAAEAAMDATADLEAYRESLARNREKLLAALPAMGLSEFLPIDGAFYVFADVSRYTNDSTAFARALLHEAGIAATPGIDFDRQRGNSYLRFSFAGSEADIDEAIVRLKGFMAGR